MSRTVKVTCIVSLIILTQFVASTFAQQTGLSVNAEQVFALEEAPGSVITDDQAFAAKVAKELAVSPIHESESLLAAVAKDIAAALAQAYATGGGSRVDDRLADLDVTCEFTFAERVRADRAVYSNAYWRKIDFEQSLVSIISLAEKKEGAGESLKALARARGAKIEETRVVEIKLSVVPATGPVAGKNCDTTFFLLAYPDGKLEMPFNSETSGFIGFVDPARMQDIRNRFPDTAPPKSAAMILPLQQAETRVHRSLSNRKLIKWAAGGLLLVGIGLIAMRVLIHRKN